MENNKKLSEKRAFEGAANVLKMLEGIPEQLKDLFIPKNEDQLITLELNITKFRARENERDKVMQLQKQYDLPLRPNQPMRDVMIRIRILQLQNRLKGR